MKKISKIKEAVLFLLLAERAVIQIIRMKEMKKKIALCSLLFLTSFLGLMLKGENIAAQENAGADFSARPLLEKHQIDNIADNCNYDL